jgi:hypothetical protein
MSGTISLGPSRHWMVQVWIWNSVRRSISSRLQASNPDLANRFVSDVADALMTVVSERIYWLIDSLSPSGIPIPKLLLLHTDRTVVRSVCSATMSTPLKLETADPEGTASALRELSHSTTHLSATLNSAWGQLDGGWHSYCREDADGYFRWVMTELKHMEDMLTQMGGALHGTAGLVAVADKEAATCFVGSDGLLTDQNDAPIIPLLPETGGNGSVTILLPNTGGSGDTADSPPSSDPAPHFDEDAEATIKRLECDFLASAKRHNTIPGMSDEDFAALIATIIRGEGRINKPKDDNENTSRQLEDWAIRAGVIVSGRYVKSAYEELKRTHDIGKFLTTMKKYKDLDGITANELATVGLGNMWIKTAPQIWKGQACNPFNECVPITTNPLKTSGIFGWESDVADPFSGSVSEQDA